MPKFIDLTGQRFGRLTVLKRAKNQNKRTMWECACDCGNKSIARGDMLKCGNTLSCGCLQKENTTNANFIDERGKQYGHLTVIEALNDKDSNGMTMWLCQCQCGNQLVVRGSCLRSGHTRSCGCYQKHKVGEMMFKNEIGNRYGKLIVTNYAGMQNNKALWICKCDCGNQIITYGVRLRYGDIRSCGCLSSRGEAKIADILKTNNISYVPQYSFQDLLSEKGYPLRFDFAIFNGHSLTCLLEYQGIQHYIDDKTSNWTSPRPHDCLKREYCQKNNIPLIEISYEDFEKIDWQYLHEILKPYGG